MKTRMTEMFGIKHPIMNAGMSWIAVPELVAAVSNAGGLGLLATGNLSPDKTRESIKRIRKLTDKPFGINATLLFPYGQENARVALEEKVPVINWSLGNAAPIIEAGHQYGAKVIGTVTRFKHAQRAEKDGADGVIVTGHEAAAHGEWVTTFILVREVASSLKIPVIAAGGISDGRSLAAALTLGAEGVSMGTRFSLTKESPLNRQVADACLKAGVEDTVFTEKIDGMLARWLKTEISVEMAKGGLSPVRSLQGALKIKKMLGLSWLQMLTAARKNSNMVMLARLADAVAHLDEAAIDGDLEKGCLPIGQAVGLIRDMPTVQEVIDGMVKDATQILKTLNAASQ